MPRTPLAYLDLDVWLVARPEGAGYRAYTLAEPHFCLAGKDLGVMARQCARELGLYAMTDGHAATFRVEASMLPPGMAGPADADSRLPEVGCVPVGRLLVTDVLGEDGRSLLPGFVLPARGANA